MAKIILISQFQNNVAQDLKLAKAFGYEVPNEAIYSLYDGRFSADGDGVPNLFYALAHSLKVSDAVVLGDSVSVPNTGWLNGILTWLTESKASAQVILPFSLHSPEWKRHLATWGLKVEGYKLLAVGADRFVTSLTMRYHTLLASLQDLMLNHVNAQEFTMGELHYLFHGGARRSTSMKLVIDANIQPDALGLKLVDHGAALGLVSGFMALETPQISQITGVEFSPKYPPKGQAMFDRAYDGGHCQMYLVNSSSQQYGYAETQDIICFPHMLFRIPPEYREDVVKRAWDALNPKGFIYINEILLRTPSGSYDTPEMSVPEMSVPEMRGILTKLGQAVVYRPQDFWGKPVAFGQIPEGEWSSDHIIVVKKEG